MADFENDGLVYLNGINESLGHFIHFEDPADARAFAPDVPAGCRAEVVIGHDEWGSIQYVKVFGPWLDEESAEKILEPIAARHHGEYNGTEDFHPEWPGLAG
jgi:hypothetical protein